MRIKDNKLKEDKVSNLTGTFTCSAESTNNIWLFIFPAALQYGNPVNAQILVYTGVKGEDVTILCPLTSSGTGKFFCREECKEGHILIETTSQRAQSGRYSIKYDEGFSRGTLFLTISQLTKSDSGLYRCGWGTPSSPTSYRQIEITVVDGELHEHVSLKMSSSSNRKSFIYSVYTHYK